MLTPKQKARQEKALAGQQEAKEKRIEEYLRDPKKCDACGKGLPYAIKKNKFCDHSCAASKTNAGQQKNLVHGNYCLKSCKHCGCETDNTKFCSKKCDSEYRFANRVSNFIKSGKAYGCPSIIKKVLASLHGHKCNVCQNTSWMNSPIPLVLDHIDGKPANSNLSNLRLVCGNCNMQLPTFAGKNVGKGGGRPYRNKRYLEGKSY